LLWVSVKMPIICAGCHDGGSLGLQPCPECGRGRDRLGAGHQKVFPPTGLHSRYMAERFERMWIAAVVLAFGSGLFALLTLLLQRFLGAFSPL
jgi:hypothetical protein